MKRLLVLVALLAGLAAALAFVRSEVSNDAVAARIAGVLIPFGERKPDIAGIATIRLFPRLSVVFRDVRIAATNRATLNDPDLSADSIVADIDVLPLFVGQTSVSQLVLEHPRLRLTTNFDLAGFTPDRALLDRMLPASVVVHRGEIRIRNPDATRTETLQSIEAKLRWPRALGNLSLDGSANWRGERFALSLQGIAPPRLASGEAGDLDMTIDAPSLKASFAGRALLSDHLQLDGIFATETDDLQRLSDLVSSDRPKEGSRISTEPDTPQPKLPPVVITGHLRSQGWAGALSDARLEIGPVAADGVLSARFDLARPQLRGTLAIGDIDLAPMLMTLRERHWLDWSLGAANLANLDVDLRLSIANALIGKTQLSNLAASLLLAEGQLHAEVGDASLLGGTGSVILRGSLDRNGLKAGGRFTLVGAPLNALRRLFSLDGLPPGTGALSLIGDFETAGDTLNAAITRLHGQIRTEAQRLVLDGFAAPAVAFAAAQSPMLQAASPQLGLNPEISQLLGAITFTAGNLDVERLDFTLGGLKFGLAGHILPTPRMVELVGTAHRDSAPVPTAAGDLPPPEITQRPENVRIRVTGTLDRPIVLFGPGDAADPATTTDGSPDRPISHD